MFFVYIDWTTEDVPRPFYVGKGNLSRVIGTVRNKHHAGVARKYGLHRQIVIETTDERLAFDLETRYVAQHHTFVGDPNYNGVGTNHTMGGEGSSGLKFSDESRKLLSESRRVCWSEPTTRQNYLESFSNPDVQDKKRAVMRELHSQPDFKKKHSDAVRLTCQRPEVRKQRSETTKEVCRSPEVKQRRSEAQKKAWIKRHQKHLLATEVSSCS